MTLISVIPEQAGIQEFQTGTRLLDTSFHTSALKRYCVQVRV